ncbi:MAG: 5-deoxy-glucuronate isomerase [Planctomycetes bacterium]|nr:5-deoxy-glucuronate isomerase [Planctomycetota bacterium]
MNDALRAVPATGLTSFPGSAWFTRLQTCTVADRLELTTGDEETCALILAGTFDLQGGGTMWQSRGARTTPLVGRPMAVFLPPRTPFVAAGTGEILFVGARQPAAPEPDLGRAALSRKPLLPLAGSGKAFDPGSGEWKPAETFPTAPESLPPRRMQRDVVDGIAVERVFGVDYKAATLSVDEAVLPAGATLRLQAIPGLPRALEVLLYLRGAGMSVTAGDRTWSGDGDRALCVPWSATARVSVQAGGEPGYLVVAFAGK